MTASSSKLLVRLLPIGAILVAGLIVALTFAPDTFRYRGWPKAPTAAPLQSLSGLAPRLGTVPAIGPRVSTSSPGSPSTASTAGTTGVTPAARPISSPATIFSRPASPTTAQGATTPGSGGGGHSQAVGPQPRRGGTDPSRGNSGAGGASAGTGDRKSTPPPTVVARTETPARPAAPAAPVETSYQRHDWARRISYGDREHRSYEAHADAQRGAPAPATARSEAP